MVQLKIRCAVKSGLSRFSLPVLNKDQIKLHTYHVIGRETLTLPIGQIETIKIQRIRDNKTRQTLVWLAPQWDYLLVKAFQKEEDATNTLALSHLDFL